MQGLEGGEGEFQNDVPQDEVSVIFIELDTSAKTRNIFTAVNRYAKSTTAGQNYAIDNTDGYAIVNRKLINDIIPDIKINTKGSAIPERSAHLTTLASLFESYYLDPYFLTYHAPSSALSYIVHRLPLR